MKTLEEQLQCRPYRSLILKNPKVLVGPAQVSWRNVPTEAPRTAERLRLRKVRFPTPQFLSHLFLLGDIHQRADEARHLSAFEHRNADAPGLSSRAVLADNPLFHVAADPFRDHAFNGCFGAGPVIGMDQTQVIGNARDSLRRIESQNVEQL